MYNGSLVSAPKVSMKSESEKLLSRHESLVKSEMQKVTSHVQRKSDGWVINTVMIDGYDVPFRYKRKRAYKTLVGALVNLTYYASTDSVAGIEMEIMNVVRIQRA